MVTFVCPLFISLYLLHREKYLYNYDILVNIFSKMIKKKRIILSIKTNILVTD